MSRHFFIGIKTPSILEETVRHWREKYELAAAYKAIPHMDDLHLTLLFIGALPEEKLPQLKQSLESIADEHKPFSLKVNGLSYFGSPKGPRVVYLSVEYSSSLDALQKSIAGIGARELGIEEDNRFTPHITIAKKRKITGDFPIQKETCTPIDFKVAGFSLYTIHPSKSPKYEIVEHFELT